MLKKVNVAVFYFLIIFTPSLFCFYFTDVFEFPKVYLLTIFLLLEILYAIFVIKKISLTKLDLILIFYLFLNYISAFLSLDFQASLFGYFGNPVSSVLFLTAIVLFLIISKPLLKPITTGKFYTLLIYSSVFPVIYGLLQIINKDFFSWKGGLASVRVFSTFGQPNFYAIFLSVIFFICLREVLEFGKKNYAVYFIFVAILLFKTLSLGSFISLFLFLVLYICLFFKKINKKYLFFIFVSSVLVFVLFGSGVIPRIKNQLAGGSKNIIFTDDTATIRLILWENTLNQSLSFKNLIIGNGPDNFVSTFYRPKELNKTSEWGLVFYKPHNIFLEQLYSLGFFGLATFIYLIILSFKNFKKDSLNFLPLLLLLLSISLWLPSYLLFVFYLFLYKQSSFGELYNFKLSKFKRLFFTTPLVLLFLLSILYAFSNFYYHFEPCISYNIFPKYQPYTIECGIKSNSDSLVKQGYELNHANKVYVEKVGLYFLNKKDDYGLFVFRNALLRDSEDPIYLYYTGLATEVFGDKKDALLYYKEAQKRSFNFYENDSAIQRITNYPNY